MVKSFVVRSVLLSGHFSVCAPGVAIAIKLATVLASVIERIVNNASPVKLRATLHPFQFGMQETKFNYVCDLPFSVS